MSGTLYPPRVTLTSGEKQMFVAAATDVTWHLSPNKGKLAGGLYQAPRLIFISKNVTVTAILKDGSPPAIGVIELSSGPLWMGLIGTLWLLMFPLLIAGVFIFWPRFTPPPPVIVNVDPPAVTLSGAQPQQFGAAVRAHQDQGVIWSASLGTITPTGLYVPPPLQGDQDQFAVITAISNADRAQSATALVILTKTGTVMVTPPSATLHANQTQQFKTVGPKAVTWKRFPELGQVGETTGTYTPPANIDRPERVTITAMDAANSAHLASATVTLLPDNAAADTGGKPQWPAEWQHFALIMTMGALGTYLSASRSFVNYIGNRQFVASWGLFYLIRPSFGVGLALLAYLGYRIGAIPGPAGPAVGDPFATSFLAGMVGLFADLTLEKLRELMSVLFKTSDERTDKMTPNTAPAAITKATASAGTGQLTVEGTSFAQGARVLFNQNPLPTNFESPEKLTATFSGTQFPAGAHVTLVVENPDKQQSAGQSLTISE